MKNKILAGVCLLGLFAAAGATGVWPDGSAMDAWFADKSPVDEAKLGRQYFASQMLGAKVNAPELQTKPLQMTIDWIASQGGGVLVLGPGVWNTSALFFKPGVHLKLEKGAVLHGPEDGSVVPRGMTHFVGHSFVYTLALINADACNGFTIYGEGTIDGNGKKSWIDFWKKRKTVKGFKDWDIPRPRNIYVSNSRDVRISGVTIKDSHFWTVQFYKCERVKVDHVRITAPGHMRREGRPRVGLVHGRERRRGGGEGRLGLQVRDAAGQRRQLQYSRGGLRVRACLPPCVHLRFRCVPLP